MNKQVIRCLYCIIVTSQIMWWIKAVFIDGTPVKSSDFDPHVEHTRNSELIMTSKIQENELGIDTLNLHIQKIKDKFDPRDVEDVGLNKEEIFKKYFNKRLGHTIFPRSSSVIQKGKYIKNRSNLCIRHQELDILIIVHTSPYNFKRRAMIRKTIANNSLFPPYTVQPAFFIGVMPEAKRDKLNEKTLEDEFRQSGDIVQMAFDEDFRNLSLKAALWLRWTNEFCLNTDMILKIDDDVVLDVFKVVSLSRGLFSKYKRSIFCNVNKKGTQPIPRIGRTKVDMREFLDITIYPYTYCSGFIVFLTPDLIPLLHQTFHRVPFYNVDDLFMFGMLPRFVGQVTYHNIGYNISIWHDKVYNCTIKHGVQCSYFGTMAENAEHRESVWQAMRDSHQWDFRFPHFRLA